MERCYSVSLNEPPTEQSHHRSHPAKDDAYFPPKRTLALNQFHAKQQSADGEKSQKVFRAGFGNYFGKFFGLRLPDLIIAVLTAVLAVKTSRLHRETAGGMQSAAGNDTLLSLPARTIRARGGVAPAEVSSFGFAYEPDMNGMKRIRKDSRVGGGVRVDLGRI